MLFSRFFGGFIQIPVRMKYDKIPVKAGGEAMSTDTTIAKNIRVADEKAS